MMKYDPIQIIKYIVWLASQHEIPLTWVRIVKFLYLADLYQARIRNGETLTGWPWAFVHFGPYCTPAYEAVENAASMGVINKRAYESHFEGRDEYDLFSCDDQQEPAVSEKLHIYVVSQLDNAIKKWGDDTAKLLDHVYFETEPMRDAQPSQVLDFSSAKKTKIAPKVEMNKISERSIEKGRSIIERLKKKHTEASKKQKEREKNRIACNLYDDAYDQAMKYMDGEDLEPGLKGVAKIKS